MATPLSATGPTIMDSATMAPAIRNKTTYSREISARTSDLLQIATQAARDQHRKDYYRQRIRGMAQKQHKLLNQGDLNQNIARAYKQEEEQGWHDALAARQALA